MLNKKKLRNYNLYYFFVLFFSILTVNAQYITLFTTCDWKKIVLNNNYNPQATDTCIVLATVRGFDGTKKQFLTNDRDSLNTIRYFNIYHNGDKWICVQAENLTEALKNKKDLQAIVFVEGFGRTFLKALDRVTYFNRTYGYQMILFDWPTYNPDLKTRINFKRTKRYGKILAQPFGNFIDSLSIYKSRNENSFKSLVLLMHSMGNLLMMNAIQSKHIKTSTKVFNSIILNSACVPQKQHKKWIEQMYIQQRIYITRNDRDKTLRGAKLISGFKNQLGHKPRKPFATNAIYLDFSRVLDIDHNYFLYPTVLNEKPYIKTLYNELFSGSHPDFSNENRYIKKPKKNRIELFDLKEAQKGGISLGVGM